MPLVRKFATLVLCALPALALPSGADAQPHPGRDYEELKVAQPVEQAGKVEVLEFFWYGCIHCYNLEPTLDPWSKKLPAHVHFRRVPAILNPGWARDAGIYYALEALGVIERLHRPLFDAIHRERLRTDNVDALNEWLKKNGVEPRKFDEALRSFGVQSRLRRAGQMSVSYRIEGTPAIAVQGRYIVGNGPDILQTTDYLIDVARRELGAKK